jgi:Protein of unknown function (DUF3024)
MNGYRPPRSRPRTEKHLGRLVSQYARRPASASDGFASDSRASGVRADEEQSELRRRRRAGDRRAVSRRPACIIAVALPGLDVAAVRAYCEQRVPPYAPHQVHVDAVVSRGAVTVVERRAPWREDYGPEWSTAGIARLRCTAGRGEWTLYWRDRNARWQRYERVEPSSNITALLDEIDSDPTGIFWG